MLHVKTETEKLYTVKLTVDDLSIIIEAIGTKNKQTYSQSEYFNVSQDLYEQLQKMRSK